MIGVDTNILVRFFVRDDEPQFRKSLSILKEESVFIPDTVLLETEWVLRYTYGFSPKEIHQAFTDLPGLPKIHVTNPDLVLLSIECHQAGMDFSDAFHLAQCGHCTRFLTFDRQLVNKAKRISKCVVEKA